VVQSSERVQNCNGTELVMEQQVLLWWQSDFRRISQNAARHVQSCNEQNARLL